MSPAVKRMQQAHRLFLVFCGTRLQNRADEDFDQTAADGIDYDRQHDAGIGVRQQIREECQPQQAGCRKNMRHDDRCPIADLVHEPGRKHIHQQLDAEVYGNQ